MKKIQLHFREFLSNVPSPLEVTALLNSERKYQNINADFRYLTNVARKLLLLESFSQSLVNLKISCENDALANKMPLNLSFPKLKSLDVKASAQINLKLLQAASKLEKLAIQTEIMNDEVVACLMEIEGLKELTLRGNRHFVLQPLDEGRKVQVKIFGDQIFVPKHHRTSENQLRHLRATIGAHNQDVKVQCLHL
jgi:hypothetical protein